MRTARLISAAGVAGVGVVLAAVWLHQVFAGGRRPDGAPAKVVSVAMLQGVMAKLRPLHRKLAKPAPGDWLYHHREPGQTFAQYVRARPLRPDAIRRVIYIQPLGEFTATRRRIIALTADLVGRYFNLPVKVRPELPLSVVPAEARRTHPTWGDRQILTGYVLEKVLRPRLPKDAFAYVAFTTSDLWPGRGWNFVFGEASLRQRVGVWSLYRYGDPDAGQKQFRLCLLRTLRVAAHELGHMFSMLHCTAYACGMCGSNSLAESDRRPLALCPECMAKVCWATQADPVARYRRLAAFCRANGLSAEAAAYNGFLKALGARPMTTSRPAEGR
jgi:archaemetzincin